ncbi:sensor histidine kinase [Dictyobacter kobayashii]|uniref:histidine kinase n=1 Tax=Dictyobacter kobayashii TaxID=2014872 RepID=A0A402AUR0_9CHLR|nr:HAMP domain-containing sensor histidine kinase [Dictyobacter kobayashii]GCE22805.1 hypothetical protein KDK_66050 [Dictyobacter kobayashii]
MDRQFPMMGDLVLRWNIFLRARWTRALIEVLVIQGFIALVLPSAFAISATQNASLNDYTTQFCAVYSLFSLLWLACRWRLRPPQRTIWQQLLIEIEVAGVLLFELSCSALFFLWLFHQANPITLMGANMTDVVPLVVCSILACIGFFALRMVLHVLVFWERLRQKRLRWAVTHSHLMVVVIGAGVISAVIVFLLLILDARTLFTDTRPLYLIISFLFVMFMCTIFTVACVLPPSILSSYIFTRRITRRIEHLALATSMLRSGDYSIRVNIEGEDEIAHLQADFNAMASALESTMRALKEERDNVQTLLNARRELIASVSHELRTPVATVRSYLESSLANWQQDQPPVTLKQDMQIIEQQTIRLQSLINDLFMLARAEVGRLETRCEPTNIELLVTRVVETIAPVAWRGSRVEVMAEIASIQPELPLALVDHNRLEQILYNLIHNGIRHTAPGGIIVVAADADEQQVILQVKDTGEGIASADLTRIWDRFYRASNAQNGTGTGLGLAIVKEFSESMGGSVAVESVLGQGSCFTIKFPISSPGAPSLDSGVLEHNSIQTIKTVPLSLS